MTALDSCTNAMTSCAPCKTKKCCFCCEVWSIKRCVCVYGVLFSIIFPISLIRLIAIEVGGRDSIRPGSEKWDRYRDCATAFF